MDIDYRSSGTTAPASKQVPAQPRILALGPCFMCDGDGAVPIEPIHDDGAIWTIVPCELCAGTGILHCEATG